MTSMTEHQLQSWLKANYPKETSYCEWKDYKNLKHVIKGKEGDDIISYISAISNMEGGHLIIGVEDKTLNIVGIEEFYSYTPENIIIKILDQTPNLSSEGFFIEPFTTSDTNKSVWIFHIPKHLPRKPVLAHNKPWQRIEDSLVRMRPEREQAILNEATVALNDWSAEIIDKATIDDLDTVAIDLAREKFKEKNSKASFSSEIDTWDNALFLDKAKVTINGKITNTAVILLGKEESSHYLLPAIAQITWKLEAEEKDYEHFGPPFLLNTTKVLQKIRNIKYKFFPDNELLSTTVNKYETRVILEGIYNCIAHQDYSLNSRIIVTEKVDRLIFSNAGSFFEGNPDDYTIGNRTPERYRNPWLASAMVNMGMIDTLGYGIHTMYLEQRKRFFPLPDYQLSDPQKVVLQIYGQVIDENYSKLLIDRKDLPLDKVVLLDRIQKRMLISDDAIAVLKKDKLISGRKPNFFVESSVAAATDDKATYIKNRAFDDKHYKTMILEYLRTYKRASREDIDKLLLNKLSDILTLDQKRNKVRNLLYALSKTEKKIHNLSKATRNPIWVLNEDVNPGK
jgi:ATP-dependent DNA helicase RecG